VVDILPKVDESVIFMDQPEENEVDILQRWFRDCFGKWKVEQSERWKEENHRWAILLFRKGVPAPGLEGDGMGFLNLRWEVGNEVTRLRELGTE